MKKQLAARAVVKDKVQLVPCLRNNRRTKSTLPFDLLRKTAAHLKREIEPNNKRMYDLAEHVALRDGVCHLKRARHGNTNGTITVQQPRGRPRQPLRTRT
jgi:hypothetical protein